MFDFETCRPHLENFFLTQQDLFFMTVNACCFQPIYNRQRARHIKPAECVLCRAMTSDPGNDGSARHEFTRGS